MKFYSIVFLICALHCLLFTTCFAGVISGKDLLTNPNEYDGKKVVYRGEVIGDVMKRGDFSWINLYDGDFAIGVYLAKELLPSIKYVGSYKITGDTLEVEGIFHARCVQHGGDVDIHAEKVSIISEGFLREEKINPLRERWMKRFFVSGSFLLVCIVLRNLWFALKIKRA
ncbi:MAG: DNA-binding protein [Candidatus Omnitrophica bacterium]|nr:DNA-binding protein [Candidatus Omnitrophota bacterium]